MKRKGKCGTNLFEMSHSSTSDRLRNFLGKILHRYNKRDFLHSDPIQFAHRYNDPADQEVVAFLSACFAYGSVTLIHRALESILKPMGTKPKAFILNWSGKNYWDGFYHRFHHDQHLLILIACIRKALCKYGSLECLFQKQSNSTGAIERAAIWFHNQFTDRTKVQPELWRGLQFLINRPSTGSACKRMNMFLRWMVRHDEIDLGIWRPWLKPSELIIPVDTHIARISYYLGLRSGNENRAGSYKMALEITNSLKLINPSDPVAYDFALTRLGILEAPELLIWKKA